jgi:hypothetical protein
MIPQPNESWKIISDKDDPFPLKDAVHVKILDVKDGWVRYYINKVFSDCRIPVDRFMLVYEKA